MQLVPIGTWSAHFAEGARCTVFSEAGSYRATILPLKALGYTFDDEIDTAPIGWRHAELRVDALSRNAREALRLGIEIGDYVAIDPQPEFLGNGFIVSRHLDYYRSDAAAAEVAGHDVRSALITFGVDASHGYERIHLHALRSLAELLTAYVVSPVEIKRDAEEISGLSGFTTQPMDEAPADVSDTQVERGKPPGGERA